MKGYNVMRTPLIVSAFILALTLCAAESYAQTRTFTDADEGYALELPSPSWVAVQASNRGHRHTKFVYSGGGDWRLRIRRELVDSGVTTAVAAGGILAMLVDTMIPEAFEQAHDFAGLITVLGFLLAFVLTKIGD